MGDRFGPVPLVVGANFFLGAGSSSSLADAKAARDGLDNLGLLAILFDHVANVDDALEAGVKALFSVWVHGLR
jgi:hypothetical protein